MNKYNNGPGYQRAQGIGRAGFRRRGCGKVAGRSASPPRTSPFDESLDGHILVINPGVRRARCRQVVLGMRHVPKLRESREPERIVEWAEQTGLLEPEGLMIDLPPWHYGLCLRRAGAAGARRKGAK